MDKVTYKELKSALVTMDNSSADDRTYDISADVRISNSQNVDSFEQGTVMKDSMTVATFYCYGMTTNMSISYQNAETDTQPTIMEQVNNFINDVISYVKANEPVIPEPEEPTEEELNTIEQLTVLSRMTINTLSLTDEESLTVKDLYPLWEDLIGQSVDKDFKLQYKGKLYKVLQQHTVQEEWKPGIDTASLYTVISASATEEHAGTKEDPIPYVQNMVLEKDKYYTQDGVLYICIQSTITGYPNDLKDLASLVQKVEE